MFETLLGKYTWESMVLNNDTPDTKISIHLTGKPYWGNHKLNIQEFWNFSPKSDLDIDSWLQYSSNLKGFYSFVVYTPSTAILAVDRIRSLPIFYAPLVGHLIISDSVESISRPLKICDFDSFHPTNTDNSTASLSVFH